VSDLLFAAQAKADARGVIGADDLPITKGLQERIHEFRKLDAELELQPILEHLAKMPPLDVGIGDDVREELPVVVGGISLALARTFKVLDPDVKNPQSWHWERAFEIFDMLL